MTKDVINTILETALVLKTGLINESVLDPIQATRCKDVFDDREIMKEPVKRQILNIFNEWIKDKTPIIKLKDMRMIGSSSGFQYRDDSDIDIECDIEYDGDINTLYKILPNGNNLIGTSHPINYYLINLKTETYPDEKFCENIYDILNDKWIKKSDKSDLKVPFTYVEELSRFFTDSFDLTLSQFERLKCDYERYETLNPEKQEISEAELTKVFEDLKHDISTVLDKLVMGRSILKSFQNSAFKDGNMFKISIQYITDDPRFSVNNLIYKNIERLGYHDKITSAIDGCRELISKISSRED